MKKFFLLALALGFFIKSNAQEILPYPTGDTRVITTGTAFLVIASDARAAGMADQGVATSPDAYSQQWNLSKYAFGKSEQGVALSYTPYLTTLVNDIFLGNFTYYKKLDEGSAISASFRYFSLGELEFTEDGVNKIVEKPNELTLDVGYSLKLSEQFSMGVGLRYIRSDLKLQNANLAADASAASTFAVDIGGYYESNEKAYSSFNGKWRGGFAIQNIGPKIKYEEGGKESFLPTTLRLGGGFDFILDEANKVALTLETTKLLVPTPPIRGFVDSNGNGTYDAGEERDVVYKGKEDDVNFFTGMFQSFGDAPGGFSEEIEEFTYSIGAEYSYQDAFAFRLGYFNEPKTKGARKFFSLGAGFKYNVINIDVSYLFSVSQVPSPLENTLRFSLAFDIGGGAND